METARYVGFRALCPEASRRQILKGVLTDRGVGMVTSLIFVVVSWFGFHNLNTLYPTISMAVLGVVGLLIFARVMSSHAICFQVALVVSVLVHALTCAAVFYLCRGLGINLDLWLLTLAVSAAVFGAVIPFALAGVQAGDFVAAGILTYFGVDPVVALTVASVYYLTRLQGALIGAGVEVRRSSLGLMNVVNARQL
jgi:hypothetical protein